MRTLASLSLTRWLLPGVLVLLAACSTSLPETSIQEINGNLSTANTGSFGPRPDIPTPADLHYLTDAQKAHFLDWMNDRERADLKSNLRMFKYIEKFSADFNYTGNTGNASLTMATRSGNCMALAVLTTALADVAGLDIDWELMDDSPVYELNGTSIKKGMHIRTIIYEDNAAPGTSVFQFTRPGIKIDYFPTNRQRFVSNLSRTDYLAMYYQNLATEALDEENYNQAYWLAMEALDLVPDYSPTINLLAVLNRRTGNLEVAESIYRYGIERARDKLTLMKNYRVLLETSGRKQEARALVRQLETMDDPSPFHWYQLARASQDDGEYLQAIRFYRRALDIAPYLHEAWLGIAQANYALGRYNRSRSALKSAFEEAERVGTRALYEEKLASLTQGSGI